jgi:hypothetical protein
MNFSIPLPDLSLKLEKKTTSSNENKNENKNNINNTIIINNTEDKTKTIPSLPESIYLNNDDEDDDNNDENARIKSLCFTPEPIKLFKDHLLHILINYFSNDLCLINNLLELSRKIILKEKDLKKLLALLITDGDESKIAIDYELPEKLKSCSCCEHIPVYRKILSIIIDNKYEFKYHHNQYATQIQTEFNISLDYILK